MCIHRQQGERIGDNVLILVVVEYALCDQITKSKTGKKLLVLILVVVEYALCALKGVFVLNTQNCLNPCCCGVCSMCIIFGGICFGWVLVLILVVVEYALCDTANVLGVPMNRMS